MNTRNSGILFSHCSPELYLRVLDLFKKIRCINLKVPRSPVEWGRGIAGAPREGGGGRFDRRGGGGGGGGGIGGGGGKNPIGGGGGGGGGRENA